MDLLYRNKVIMGSLTPITNSMLALNQVHEGDCLELMKEIPDGSVDMVLCDPPY